MGQVMTRCKVKTICMKKWNRQSVAKYQNYIFIKNLYNNGVQCIGYKEVGK